MKLSLHFLLLFFLLLVLIPSKANENYEISTLYLALPFYQSIEVSLGDYSLKKQGSYYVANGIKPGKYLLTIQQEQHFISSILTNSESYEWVLYCGYIQIPPKRVIYAQIDAIQNFRIIRNQATKTVINTTTHLPYWERVVCLLRDS